MDRLRVGMVFGGVSPEHEVSVISTLQAAAAIDRDKYEPVPVYIAKDGSWYTGGHLFDVDHFKDLKAVVSASRKLSVEPSSYGKLVLVPQDTGRWFGHRRDPLTLDVMFVGLHGGAGENGGLQGLFETVGVPYTGSGVFGSAIGMDKVQSKMLCRDQGVPVVPFMSLHETGWADQEESRLDRCEEQLGYPLIVKPARLGSSIGISRATDRRTLDAAIEEAFRYDAKIVIERAIVDLMEINCSVMGTPHSVRTSVLEQPTRSSEQELLTYADKYMREGGGKRGGNKRSAAGMAALDRIIPAPIPEASTTEITQLAGKVFTLLECSGVARIDFLIDQATDQVYFNEINTIPGSFSFYLWEPSGVSFPQLVDEMIQIALQRHQDDARRVRTYDVDLLSEKSLAGLKTAKMGS